MDSLKQLGTTPTRLLYNESSSYAAHSLVSIVGELDILG